MNGAAPASDPSPGPASGRRERPLGFLFSGQGSQFYHMGEELYEGHRPFRAVMDGLDRIVRDRYGEPLLPRLFDDRQSKGMPFDEIRYSHPAIFCVQYALAESLRQAGIVPDFVLGISLGEFVAAAAAGALTARAALGAVMDQAAIFEHHTPPGGMLAILSDPGLMDRLPRDFDGCELAGINFAGHFVVAGPAGRLDRLEEILSTRDILVLRLPVRIAFHSALLEPAAQAHSTIALDPAPLAVPMLSCRRGDFLDRVTPEHFWDVARFSTRFPNAITAAGRRFGDAADYLDLGPGGTLANFIKRGMSPGSRSTCHSVITPFGGETGKLAEILSRWAGPAPRPHF